MKIDNVNIDEFLKDNKMVINQKKSEELSKKKPSIKQKHIKNKKCAISSSLRDNRK